MYLATNHLQRSQADCAPLERLVEAAARRYKQLAPTGQEWMRKLNRKYCSDYWRWMIASGRYHHPTRAARAGTPVRSRFCNSNTELPHRISLNLDTPFVAP
jgi:hypothetical protein